MTTQSPLESSLPISIPVASPLLGAHMPTAGGVQFALTSGQAIGCEAVQLFTSSPRQWKGGMLKESSVEAFKTARDQCGTKKCIAHDSYLINLAAPEGEILDKSLAAFREELERAEALGLDYLVTHMGAHGGDGDEVGLHRLSESLNKIHRDLPGYTVKVALETTAGQGTYLGAKFEHFPQIFAQVGEHERLAVCLDTCHVFAAGYDLRTTETYAAVMDAFEQIVGKGRLQVIHANDSAKKLGSNADRHAHLGEGEIGLEAFWCLVNDPRVAGLPVVIETPDSETMHGVNLKRLKDLVGASAAPELQLEVS